MILQPSDCAKVCEQNNIENNNAETLMRFMSHPELNYSY
ncbi:hypothetical protein NOR51B_826 [Luminiphilus syltensis NOR5-1B]|uniref:Uncharacterized protein n=1 Tax=Luminiphilus syltensis NOR5-1B TaxID=565045 RepID=B8KSI6_9GAMM|nr:hypothetical protein NOR51B_826 [Luminiphilus syltensis NOR5-1B]